MMVDRRENSFNILIKISLILYIVILFLAIMLKSFMIDDVVASFNYLSTFTLEDRFVRGINLIEFYKIEYELGIINRTIILDVLNCFIFVPFGILVAHFINKYKILKVSLITLCVSLFIELFQLITIIGSFMLNDLITNVLGGIIGAILYILITKGKKYSIYNILLSIFILIEIVVVGYLIVGFISNFSTYIELLSQIL